MIIVTFGSGAGPESWLPCAARSWQHFPRLRKTLQASYAGWRTKCRMRLRRARARDSMRPIWITSRWHVEHYTTWNGD